MGAFTQQEDADPSDAQRASSELRKDAEADHTDVGNAEFLGRHQIRIQYIIEVANLEKGTNHPIWIGIFITFFFWAICFPKIPSISY